MIRICSQRLEMTAPSGQAQARVGGLTKITDESTTIGTNRYPNLATPLSVQLNSAVAPPGGCTDPVAFIPATASAVARPPATQMTDPGEVAVVGPPGTTG